MAICKETSKLHSYFISVIIKDRSSGVTPEKTSSNLGINLQQILQALSQPLNDNEIVQLFRQGKAKYFCPVTEYLMSPRKDPDSENVYDVRFAELEFPNTVLQIPEELQREIQDFSKQIILKCKLKPTQQSKVVVRILAECMTVLDIGTDLECFVENLKSLNFDNSLVVLEIFKSCSDDWLIDLLRGICDRKEAQLFSLLIVQEFLVRDNCKSLDFETVIECFLRILRQTEIIPEAIDFVWDSRTKLSYEHFIKVQQALDSSEKELATQWKVNELKLRLVNYLDYSELTLVLLKTLYPYPELNEQLEEIFQTKDYLKDERLIYYEFYFANCVEKIPNAYVAEGLRTVYKLITNSRLEKLPFQKKYGSNEALNKCLDAQNSRRPPSSHLMEQKMEKVQEKLNSLLRWNAATHHDCIQMNSEIEKIKQSHIIFEAQVKAELDELQSQGTTDKESESTSFDHIFLRFGSSEFPY